MLYPTELQAHTTPRFGPLHGKCSGECMKVFSIYSAFCIINWGGRGDSNPQQLEPQSSALTVELRPPSLTAPGNSGSYSKTEKPFSVNRDRSPAARNSANFLARLRGFEPLAYCLEGSCSIRLSYGVENHVHRQCVQRPTRLVLKLSA